MRVMFTEAFVWKAMRMRGKRFIVQIRYGRTNGQDLKMPLLNTKEMYKSEQSKAKSSFTAVHPLILTHPSFYFCSIFFSFLLLTTNNVQRELIIQTNTFKILPHCSIFDVHSFSFSTNNSSYSPHFLLPSAIHTGHAVNVCCLQMPLCSKCTHCFHGRLWLGLKKQNNFQLTAPPTPTIPSIQASFPSNCTTVEFVLYSKQLNIHYEVIWARFTRVESVQKQSYGPKLWRWLWSPDSGHDVL